MTDNPFVVITSRGHIPRIRAPQVLMENNYPNWCVVVDNKEQADGVIQVGVPRERIIIADTPSTLPRMIGINISWLREWIENNIVPKNTWYVTIDDNVYSWTWLPEPWYSRDKIDLQWEDPGPEANGQHWRKLYETPCPFAQVVKIWKETIQQCEAIGTVAGGYSVENNFFFRGNKWQRLGNVKAQNAVWKNVGLPFYCWKTDNGLIYGAGNEDLVHSIDIVAHYGQILNNRYLKLQKPMFEEGGIGSLDMRMPRLIELAQQLLQHWEGLLRENKNRSHEVTFALRSPERVKQWQDKHQNLSRMATETV